jgi:glycosyltransferase involved in cell wall biosynthesis
MKAEIKHIAVFIGSMRMGGAERASLNLVNEFASRGIRCDLILVHEEGEFLADVHPDVHIVPLGKGRTLFSGFALRRYLRSFRPRVMIASQTHVQLLALWACKKASVKVPLILNEHSTFSTNHPLSSMKSIVIRKLAKRWFPRANVITAVSEGVRNDLLNVFPELKDMTVIIYNPVINQALLDKSKEEIELPWNDDPSIPMVMAAGRLVADKNFDVLIKAVAMARKTRRICLVILGEGEEKYNLSHVAQQAELGEDISLYGYTKNPYAWMRKADLFVLSSRREGLPMVLIEAMATGCKVVSTDCPSGPREILQDGKLGFLVPVGDIQAMSDAIIKSLGGSGSEQAIEEALKPYHVTTVCDQYLELMSSLIRKDLR